MRVELEEEANEEARLLLTSGHCLLFFGSVLVWDLYELYMVGEVSISMKMSLMFESGFSLMIFHALFCFISLLTFFLAWRKLRNLESCLQ